MYNIHIYIYIYLFYIHKYVNTISHNYIHACLKHGLQISRVKPPNPEVSGDEARGKNNTTGRNLPGRSRSTRKSKP